VRFKTFNNMPVKKQKEFFCYENGQRVKKIRVTFYAKDPADPTGEANLKLVVSEADWQRNARDVYSDERRSVVVRGKETTVHS
jgi:RecA/RadA recombinase